MNARSALFDLYGDHLRSRSGRAPVAALVRLLAALGIAAPAVRTAVSRMVRQGWLVPVRTDGAPGYALTPRAARRLDEAAARIYRTRAPEWDGRWHLLVVRAPTQRVARDRLRAGLGYLGYAALSETTWLAPRASAEVAALLEAEGASAEGFHAAYEEPDATALAARTWDLGALGAAYEQWLVDARQLVAAAGEDPDDERAFAVRSRLVHEWRKFLFRDPGLPACLLPADWPGATAAAFFDAHAARLQPGAARFVDRTLSSTVPADLQETP